MKRSMLLSVMAIAVLLAANVALAESVSLRIDGMT